MIPDKGKAFIGCLQCSREYGFNDLSIVTHAYHESGGFRKVIGGWNFWGIKKPSTWKGQTVLVDTHEYINGKYVAVKDAFIDFPTIEQAVLWYCDFIKRLYPLAFERRKEPPQFFKGLVEGKLKYATDPSYAAKLTKLYYSLLTDKEILSLIAKGA